jgi:anti-anti-sigma regulatory factor
MSMDDKSLGAGLLAAGYEAVCENAIVRFENHHAAAVVWVSGVITSTTTDFLAHNLRLALELATPLVVDLSGVDSLCDSGVAVLLNFDRQARTAGAQWALVPDDATRPLLKIADQHRSLPLSASLFDALDTVSGWPR